MIFPIVIIGAMIVFTCYFYMTKLNEHAIRFFNMKKKNDSKLLHSTAKPKYIVPNFVHFVRFGQPHVTFVEMLCIKSALVNIKPEKLFIHCDTPPTGEFWEQLKHQKSIKVIPREKPKSIFGRSIKVIQHASDVARMEILMEYGGIYLDNDVYVVRSFDIFREYSFTVGWTRKKVENTMGNQIQVSARQAPFLLKYYDMYHRFNDSLWYFNAGELPVKELLEKNPFMAHWVPDDVFGVSTGLIFDIFTKKVDWQYKWYAIHLLYGHRHYLTKDGPKEHTPENIKKLDTTFGQMARLIYYGTEEFVD